MKMRTGRRRGLVWWLTLGLWLWAGSMAAAGPVVDGNQGREGQALEIKSLLARGKYTLVDFWSPYCEPCLKIAPIMKKLAATRADLQVVKLNINRPGTTGIDWKSPLAQQYNLRSIPHLVIFDKKGKQMAAGRPAFDLFVEWAKQAGL